MWLTLLISCASLPVVDDAHFGFVNALGPAPGPRSSEAALAALQAEDPARFRLRTEGQLVRWVGDGSPELSAAQVRELLPWELALRLESAGATVTALPPRLSEFRLSLSAGERLLVTVRDRLPAERTHTIAVLEHHPWSLRPWLVSDPHALEQERWSDWELVSVLVRGSSLLHVSLDLPLGSPPVCSAPAYDSCRQARAYPVCRQPVP